MDEKEKDVGDGRWTKKRSSGAHPRKVAASSTEGNLFYEWIELFQFLRESCAP